MEIWKPAFGYETTHEVSNYGNVRGYRRKKILTPPLDQRGYKRTKIGKKSVRVHRLVALTFIPNPDNKPQVNHIDGDKTNNHIENLEWVTNDENREHAVKLGLYKDNKSVLWEKLKRKVVAYGLDGKLVGEFESLQEAARQLNADASNIHAAINGRIKSHRGYLWKYVEKEG